MILVETEKEKTLRKEYVFADSKVSEENYLDGSGGERGTHVFGGLLVPGNLYR